MDGRQRSAITIGAKVAIVLKEDQRSGELTRIFEANGIRHRVQTHRVQLIAHGFQQVDLVLFETVAAVLDPVGTLQCMEIEAKGFHTSAPVASGRYLIASHQDPAARMRPVPPNPPR